MIIITINKHTQVNAVMQTTVFAITFFGFVMLIPRLDDQEYYKIAVCVTGVEILYGTAAYVLCRC